MPGVIIEDPRKNQQVMLGQPFDVSGEAFDLVVPEPHTIVAVTVRVDHGPLVHASLEPPIVQQKITTVAFAAQDRVTGGQDPHIVTVTAANEKGQSGSKTVAVYVGRPPLDATFNGLATLQTRDTRAPGPYFDPLGLGVEFSSTREIVTFARLPDVEASYSPGPGTTLTVTVSQVSGGVGMFTPQSGAMTVPMTLSFHVVVKDALGNTYHDATSLLPLVLSTGSEHSPTGAYHDTGEPLQPDGSITLVGDGQFSGGDLNGSDASLVVGGKISPHP
jgi:hypothetical protein